MSPPSLVGILYDHTNPNFGDRAVGLSLGQVLAKNKIDFEEVPNTDLSSKILSRFATVIVGGGHLLRKSGSSFYDQFKLSGKNILNTCGLSSDVDALEFLKDYAYVSVRSGVDFSFIKSMRPDATVSICSTLSLNTTGIECPVSITEDTILINGSKHIFSSPEKWVDLFSTAFPSYRKILVSITPYNKDYEALEKMAAISKWELLKDLPPEKIIALIEHPRIAGVISASLHATLFAYRAGKRFLVWPSAQKTLFFLSERGFDALTWNPKIDAIEMGRRLWLCNPDHLVEMWRRDKLVLDSHLNRLVSTCRELIGR